MELIDCMGTLSLVGGSADMWVAAMEPLPAAVGGA